MYYRTFLAILLFWTTHLLSQKQINISTILVENNFSEFKINETKNRTFLKQNKTLLTKINPLHYISGALLYFYQNIISEQIQANCQYQVSCSENMKKQISTKGLLFGVLNGLDQLGNCSGSILSDYPAYKITKEDKVNNAIE